MWADATSRRIQTLDVCSRTFRTYYILLLAPGLLSLVCVNNHSWKQKDLSITVNTKNEKCTQYRYMNQAVPTCTTSVYGVTLTAIVSASES